MDGDGTISMDDFRYMLDLHKLPSLAQFGAGGGAGGGPSVASMPSRDRSEMKGNNGDIDR